MEALASTADCGRGASAPPPRSGLILGTQIFRAAGVVRILPTHTFSGCRHICILPTVSTETVRVAGGFAFYLHTLSTKPRALS